jgi:hypothetical protein
MMRHSGLLFVVLSVPTASFAADSTAEKLQAFKNARVDLSAKVDAFIGEVNACNPPVFKKELLEGFQGPTDPSQRGSDKDHSVKNLLAIQERNVVGHATAASQAFSAIEASSKACADKTMLLGSSAKASSDAQTSFAVDAKNLSNVMSQASGKKAQVMQILAFRATQASPATPGDVAACDRATKMIPVMEAGYDAMAKAQQDLANAYALRSVDLGTTINAAANCGAPLQKASWVTEPEAETGAGVIGI